MLADILVFDICVRNLICDAHILEIIAGDIGWHFMNQKYSNFLSKIIHIKIEDMFYNIT